MKWYWLALAVIITGCSGGTPISDAQTDDDAKPVKYADLERNVGETVKTVAWVFGEGESYKLEGKFVFALVPSPEVDWRAFFVDYDEMEELVTSLDGEPDRRAEARDVDQYMMLQQAVNSWNWKIKRLEEGPVCNAWGHFKQSVLTAEYDYIGDTPLILVSPTRAELKSAADKVFARYQQIEKSCELEIIGVVRGIGDWAQETRVNTSLGPELGRKKLVIEVKSYKVLRTARGAVAGGKMGTVGVEKAQVEGGR